MSSAARCPRSCSGHGFGPRIIVINFPFFSIFLITWLSSESNPFTVSSLALPSSGWLIDLPLNIRSNLTALPLPKNSLARPMRVFRSLSSIWGPTRRVFRLASLNRLRSSCPCRCFSCRNFRKLRILAMGGWAFSVIKTRSSQTLERALNPYGSASLRDSYLFDQ